MAIIKMLQDVFNCEGNACGSVCLSACVTQKLLLQLTGFFFTQNGVYPWLRPSVKLFASGSGSGLQNILNDSSPLRDRTT